MAFYKQTSSKANRKQIIDSIFDILQLFTGHRQNNIGTARLKRGYLREGPGNKVHTLVILVFICLSPNNKLVTVPISIVTNQPMAQYHKYDVL